MQKAQCVWYVFTRGIEKGDGLFVYVFRVEFEKTCNEAGESAEAWLETCEGYRFTALAVVAVVERLFQTSLAGTLTPSQAFGADFVLAIDET